MTNKEIIEQTLKLIEEYTDEKETNLFVGEPMGLFVADGEGEEPVDEVEKDIFTQDEDIKLKLYDALNITQKELALIRPRTRKLEYLEGNNKEIEKPEGFLRVINANQRVNIVDNKLSLEQDKDTTIRYEYLPSHVGENNLEEELQIDLDMQVAMPYGMASYILKADPSADYTIFEYKYQELKGNINTFRTLYIKGGIR